MARFRRNLHPVNTVKHVVDRQGGIAIDTNVSEELAHARDNPTVATVNDIAIASHINGIFLNVQVTPTSEASIANVYMYVMKNPGSNFAKPKGNAVGVSDVKKFIIHQEMIMCQQEAVSSIPRTLFKGVIAVPGSYKRFGVDDSLVLVLYAPGCTFNYCVQCIYKEIR